MNELRFHGLLGLAYRAKRLAMGEDSLLALSRGKTALVIVASDSSANTKKKANDKGLYYQVPVLELSTKAELGLALGKKAVAILCVNDKKLAQSILNIMKEGDVDGKIQKTSQQQ